MATLKDIASKAEVSITTVSRVLNCDESLSITKEKRKLIIEIAEELNYKVPRVRNQKSSSRPKLKITLVHWMTVEQELNDPYYVSIRLGIEKKCQEENIELNKVFKCDDINDNEIRSSIGVIAVGKFSNEEISNLKKLNETICFVDSSPQETQFDSVVFDCEKAVKAVMDYLTKERHFTKIGYIGGREEINEDFKQIDEKREFLFKSYLNELGLLNDKHIYVGNFSFRSGYELMKTAINNDNLPEAFFIGSDTMAIGALRAAHESGLRIPEDIAIIGFNDIKPAQYTFPTLSTVKIHTQFMGRTAVELMIEQFNGRDINKKVIIPIELIKRDSA